MKVIKTPDGGSGFSLCILLTENCSYLLLPYFLMFALCRCCLIHSMDDDASNTPEVVQKSDSTSTQNQPSRTRKRMPKKCSKCGKSVLNLSRHQKDVHGMKKLRRKLGDYFTGEKKKPKGTVKFCPLSPCKGNRTPIFQLHKHLQTSIHGLRPNTPSYIKALNRAPRVSLKQLESHVKNAKEKNRRAKHERRRRQQESSSDEDSQDTDKQRVTLEESRRMKEGRRMKREENSSDDEKHEIEGNRAVQGSQAASQRAGAVKEENMELDSDKEYDDLTRRVWEKGHRSRGSTIQTSDSEEEVHGQISRSQDFFHRTPCTTEDQEAIVVTESDRDSDIDYIPGGSGTEESSNSCSSDSSILPEERRDLMIGVVEVIGRENCDSGSFLDYETELPWKKEIQNFIAQQESQGYCFKTEEESVEDLKQHFQQEDSDDEILQGIFMKDESDNDDALDEEWEPSDCEPDAEETKEHRQEELGVSTSTLLAEFYEYLTDVDGGYRSVKVAQQYKSQVQSIIRTCKMKLTESNPEKHECEDLPSFHSLLISGMTGVRFLRSWLSYVVEKYQPGTVRSYLMSLRLFYKFLSQEEVPLPNVTKDLLNARRDLMTSWSSAQKKKVLKRKLEKHDEGYRKLLSSENLHKVCHGSLHVNAVKQLAATSTETNRGDITEKILSDKSHCQVRDWLMTRILIDNSGRSGVLANMTTSEFREAVFYHGTDDDLARYRVDVKDHKTAGVYGSANVWIYDNLYVLIDMYIRTVRSQFIPKDSEVQQVFISSKGLSLTSSQVSYSVFRTFQREGVEVKGRICATTIRKSLATGMHTHMPGNKDHLAALAQHKPQTQASYYRVHDKVSQTDLGRRAVKDLVALNTKQDHPEKKVNVSAPASSRWSDEETEDLKKLFKTELETGAIEERAVSEKLTGANFPPTHTVKAVVLKLRRLREEFMQSVDLPTGQCTGTEKVMKFLENCDVNTPSESTAVSNAGESSRCWQKFTDEQTRFLLGLTDDMVANNTVKREIVWQRVASDPRSVALGLISGKEDEEEVVKAKQRFYDKVRQGAKKRKCEKK